MKSAMGTLDVFFSPKNVAVVGATEAEGRVARTILSNLVNHPFGGTVYPINLHHSNVLGIRAYRHIAETPERIDLAVLATRAASVPGLVGECVEAGVRGVIITSAGFRETGAEGARLEQQILEQARRSALRIIGPNCLGVMNPVRGLNATFAGRMARRGSVAFLSQSGALCTAVLDWSFRQNVGFSAFVSLGSMLDVDWGDLIDFLGDDPHTRSIVLYMESIGDARSFLSAAREVALSKPIIVVKAGRTEGAARAAVSHTGLLAGRDAVLDAAFRRCGVLRVNTLSDLFYMAEALGKQPRPHGPRLVMVTNAGGPAVLATDALAASGGELAELSAASVAALDAILPPHWSHGNPIDLLDEATPARYAQVVDIAVKEPNGDGTLVILTPQAFTQPTQTAELMKPFAQKGRPILACWMGGREVEAGEYVLNRADIPTFGYPDTAARMFAYMWRYSYNLRAIYETPALAVEGGADAPERSRAQEIIEAARAERRTLLSELESKELLAAYGVPTVETCLAQNADEAVRLANEIGYPVVLKVHSRTIAHKAEVGGVRLNLGDDEAVRLAFHALLQIEGAEGATVQPMVPPGGCELILGSSVDPQFGPVLLFGAGGEMVEIFEDYALALPPLTTTLARRTMEQTRIYRALLERCGGGSDDLAGLERLLVRVSQLIAEQPWVKEMDINPLRVDLGRGNEAEPGRGLLALDARVVLHDPDLVEEQLPRPAVRPYPTQYVGEWEAKDGTPLTFRPIRPEDEPLMVKFHETLSDRSVVLRYLHPILLSQRVAHERLARICFNDYDRELALVAVHDDPQTGSPAIVGVGRLSRVHGRNEAEFATLVSDAYQGKGIGTELLRRLVEIGRAEKLAAIIGFISSENYSMQRVSQRLGFHIKRDPDDPGVVQAIIDLK